MMTEPIALFLALLALLVNVGQWLARRNRVAVMQQETFTELGQRAIREVNSLRDSLMQLKERYHALEHQHAALIREYERALEQIEASRLREVQMQREIERLNTQVNDALATIARLTARIESLERT